MQMPQISAFIHVSTSYCQSTEPVLEEKGYPCAMKPEVIINTVMNLSDELLSTMTPDILVGQPNTYALSKAFAEDLVMRSGLPAGVARPSIGKRNLCHTDCYLNKSYATSSYGTTNRRYLIAQGSFFKDNFCDIDAVALRIASLSRRSLTAT